MSLEGVREFVQQIWNSNHFGGILVSKGTVHKILSDSEMVNLIYNGTR